MITFTETLSPFELLLLISKQVSHSVLRLSIVFVCRCLPTSSFRNTRYASPLPTRLTDDRVLNVLFLSFHLETDVCSQFPCRDFLPSLCSVRLRSVACGVNDTPLDRARQLPTLLLVSIVSYRSDLKVVEFSVVTVCHHWWSKDFNTSIPTYKDQSYLRDSHSCVLPLSQVMYSKIVVKLNLRSRVRTKTMQKKTQNKGRDKTLVPMSTTCCCRNLVQFKNPGHRVSNKFGNKYPTKVAEIRDQSFTPQSFGTFRLLEHFTCICVPCISGSVFGSSGPFDTVNTCSYFRLRVYLWSPIVEVPLLSLSTTFTPVANPTHSLRVHSIPPTELLGYVVKLSLS